MNGNLERMVRYVINKLGQPPKGKAKLTLRLLPNIKEALDERRDKHGDLSALVVQALSEFVIRDVDKQIPKLHGVETSPHTSILVDQSIRSDLRQAAAAVGRNQNEIVNAAIRAWLKKHAK